MISSTNALKWFTLFSANKNAEAPAWTPANLGSSLKLWLDASDSDTVILNSGNVSQWNDKSGNGNNFTQGTSADQPLYDGVGTISFDSVSEYLEHTANVSDFVEDSGTLFVVGQGVASLSFAKSSSGNNFFNMGVSGSGSSYFLRQNNSSNQDNIQSLETYSGFTIGMVSSDGSTIDLRTNGNNDSENVLDGANDGHWTNDTLETPNTMGIGSIRDSSPSYYNTDVKEMIYVSGTLSESDISNMFNYLNEKYSIY